MADNDKQRFSMVAKSAALEEDGAANVTATSEDATTAPVTQQTIISDKPEDYLIRANQGHSIAIESEGLLTPITQETLPDMAVHGTTHGAWPLIVQSGGLKRMSRTHVHFAPGLPAGFKSVPKDGVLATDEPVEDTETSAPVISGMRNSSSVLVYPVSYTHLTLPTKRIV